MNFLLFLYLSLLINLIYSYKYSQQNNLLKIHFLKSKQTNSFIQLTSKLLDNDNDNDKDNNKDNNDDEQDEQAEDDAENKDKDNQKNKEEKIAVDYSEIMNNPLYQINEDDSPEVQVHKRKLLEEKKKEAYEAALRIHIYKKLLTAEHEQKILANRKKQLVTQIQQQEVQVGVVTDHQKKYQQANDVKASNMITSIEEVGEQQNKQKEAIQDDKNKKVIQNKRFLQQQIDEKILKTMKIQKSSQLTIEATKKMDELYKMMQKITQLVEERNQGIFNRIKALITQVNWERDNVAQLPEGV